MGNALGPGKRQPNYIVPWMHALFPQFSSLCSFLATAPLIPSYFPHTASSWSSGERGRNSLNGWRAFKFSSVHAGHSFNRLPRLPAKSNPTHYPSCFFAPSLLAICYCQNGETGKNRRRQRQRLKALDIHKGSNTDQWTGGGYPLCVRAKVMFEDHQE